MFVYITLHDGFILLIKLFIRCFYTLGKTYMESPVHKEYNGENPISVNSHVLKLWEYNLIVLFQLQYKFSINVCKHTIYNSYYLASYLTNQSTWSSNSIYTLLKLCRPQNSIIRNLINAGLFLVFADQVMFMWILGTISRILQV